MSTKIAINSNNITPLSGIYYIKLIQNQIQNQNDLLFTD